VTNSNFTYYIVFGIRAQKYYIFPVFITNVYFLYTLFQPDEICCCAVIFFQRFISLTHFEFPQGTVTVQSVFNVSFSTFASA